MEHHSLDVSIACKPSVGSPAGRRMAPVHYERHRSEQTTLYRLVQQHAATFFAEDVLLKQLSAQQPPR